MQIKCPKCKKPTVYEESNPYRPFCSQRCSLIDLGEWAEERHVIATPITDDNAEEMIKAMEELELNDPENNFSESRKK